MVILRTLVTYDFYTGIKVTPFFLKKISDLQLVIDKYKPLSEANYFNVTNIDICEYNIECNDLGIGYTNSWVILCVHNSIQYKRRHDIDEKYLAVITCDITINNSKIIYCHIFLFACLFFAVQF